MRRDRDETYLTQGRIAKLQTIAARLRLALDDLPPGDYVLESAIVDERGEEQVASSFAFRMVKTPYDF